MYFKSRETAGRLLAGQLNKAYSGQPVAVLALSDGGVVVGMQIALKLRAPLMLLLSDVIDLPREPVAIGGISADGAFTYNHAYAQTEIDEIVMEYHSFLDQQKMQRLHELRHSMGNSELFRRDLLEDRIVIIVSDALFDPFTLDLAFEFLKPVRTKQVVAVTPMASVHAVDRMHVLADNILCLNVLEDQMDVDHYYSQNDMPSHESILETVEQIVKHWK